MKKHQKGSKKRGGGNGGAAEYVSSIFGNGLQQSAYIAQQANGPANPNSSLLPTPNPASVLNRGCTGGGRRRKKSSTSARKSARKSRHTRRNRK